MPNPNWLSGWVRLNQKHVIYANARQDTSPKSLLSDHRNISGKQFGEECNSKANQTNVTLRTNYASSCSVSLQPSIETSLDRKHKQQRGFFSKVLRKKGAVGDKKIDNINSDNSRVRLKRLPKKEPFTETLQQQPCHDFSNKQQQTPALASLINHTPSFARDLDQSSLHSPTIPDANKLNPPKNNDPSNSVHQQEQILDYNSSDSSPKKSQIQQSQLIQRNNTYNHHVNNHHVSDAKETNIEFVPHQVVFLGCNMNKASYDDDAPDKRTLRHQHQHDTSNNGIFPSCSQCEIYEKKLEDALDDVEYLRTVVFQEEEKIRRLNSKNNELSWSNAHHYAHVHDPKQTMIDTWSVGNQQLQEMTVRHKMQMDRMTKDILKWQQDMNVKHQELNERYTTMADKSVVQHEEIESLRHQLDTVSTERDELALENARLRAASANHREEQAELIELKARYVSYEKHGLQRAAVMIEERDTTIESLTHDLSVASARIEKLELEKKLQVEQEKRPQQRLKIMSVVPFKK